MASVIPGQGGAPIGSQFPHSLRVPHASSPAAAVAMRVLETIQEGDEAVSAASADLTSDQVMAMLIQSGLPTTPRDLNALFADAEAADAALQKQPNAGPASSELKRMMHSAFKTLEWAWKEGVAPLLSALTFTAVNVPMKLVGVGFACVAVTVIGLCKLFATAAFFLTKKESWKEASHIADLLALGELMQVSIGFHPRAILAELKGYKEIFSGENPQAAMQKVCIAKGQILTAMAAAMGITLIGMTPEMNS